MDKNIISLSNIRLFANHGCLEEEGIIGSDYRVDLTVQTDFKLSAETDNIHETIDYVALNLIVKSEMAIRSKLLEHVAYRILNRIVDNFQVKYVSVKIAKLNPPIEGDLEEVAITVERTIEA